MKSTAIKTIIAVTVASSFLACQKPGDKNASAFNKNPITVNSGKVSVTISDNSTPDELVAASEQLVTPYTFMLADEYVNLALQKQPENIKAQFYSKFLKRFQAFKGIGTRIRPYMKEADKASFDAQNAKLPPSPLKDFLFAPGAEIKTITEMQDVLGQYYAGVKEFREFLKLNENKELSISLNAAAFKEAVHLETANVCTVTKVEGASRIECQFANGLVAKKLNMADLIALRQVESGELLYGILSNSYTLDGIDKIPAGSTSEDTKRFLTENQSFGKLRPDNMFALLSTLGSDFSAAAKWVQQNQSTICPKGYGFKGQREGYFLQNGLCIQDPNKLQQALATLDNALGGVYEFTVLNNNAEVKVKADALAIAKKPIADLRSIVPTAFDACGQAISFADNTLGGTLVDGNITPLLRDCKP